VTQRERITGEVLPRGTGEPDQAARLTKTPVVPGTVELEVTPPNRPGERWTAIDDLMAAPPEVLTRDPRRPQSSRSGRVRDPSVFAVRYATGELRFGDGARGRRPPFDAIVRARYDSTKGAAGNVGVGSIATAPTLNGIKVSNPIPTWGGADPESVAESEKHVARYLQHRDRLCTAEDFEVIVRRTPGVRVGRVDVLPTYNPQLAPPTPTPGAVTVLVVPSEDPAHPGAPEPDRFFLDAICRYIDPRRLVTTEVFLRGPTYRDIWIAVAIEVEAGRSVSVVRQDVQRALMRFLAPIDPEAPPWFDDPPPSPVADPGSHARYGWPLGKAVHRLELVAVASRVAGVRLVREVQIAVGTGGPLDAVPMVGLELPRVRAIVVGETVADLDVLRGQAPAADVPSVVPVPAIPEEC
jgi:predicted phage baseplate assembly protein